MTKLNKNQLSKTSNMNIRELNILLSGHKDEVFKRMNTKFEETEYQICPFCGQKIMKHRKIKSNFEKLDNFYCDTCGKYDNIFDLYLCFKIKNGRNLILNSKTIKSIDYFEQKPYFDETLKELFKLVANSLLKEKTNAENKIKKIQNFLKFEEEKVFFEKINKISEEKPGKTLPYQDIMQKVPNSKYYMSVFDSTNLKAMYPQIGYYDFYSKNNSYHSLEVDFETIYDEKSTYNSLAFQSLNLDITKKKKSNFRYLPHDMRHTFSTFAERCGMDKDKKEVMMGHTIEWTIRGIYRHYSIEELHEEMQKLVYVK